VNLKQPGFTLVEVMIALAVVSIGLLATLSAANQEINGALITQEKMTAYWLMQNKITEIHLENQTTWPAIKHNKGTDTIFGQSWRWQTVTQKTDNKKIRTLKISLSPLSSPISDEPVLEQTLYLGKP